MNQAGKKNVYLQSLKLFLPESHVVPLLLPVETGSHGVMNDTMLSHEGSDEDEEEGVPGRSEQIRQSLCLSAARNDGDDSVCVMMGYKNKTMSHTDTRRQEGEVIKGQDDACA